MTVLNTLETFDYKTPGWSAIETANIEKIDAWMTAYSRQERDYGKTAIISVTELQYQAQAAGTWDFVEVNNKFVDLGTPLSCEVSGGGVHNLLAADGTDSTTQPLASTTYYAYVSNEDASWSPSSLRLSATAPTNGYLGASGNAANWRYVCDVTLDGSIEIEAVTGQVPKLIRDLLTLLTGDNRLDATAIKGSSEYVSTRNNGVVTRVDADTIRISQRQGTSGGVLISGVQVDLSAGAIDCAVGAAPDNLIEGGAPSASTLYNLYLVNDGTFAMSATAPTTNGYRTGDTTALHMGAVYLDGSTQVAASYNLCGYGIKSYTFVNGAISKSSGGTGYFDVTGCCLGNVVLLHGSRLSSAFDLTCYADTASVYQSSKLIVEGLDESVQSTVSPTTANASGHISSRSVIDSAGIAEIDITSQFYYTTGTTYTIDAGKARLSLEITTL